MDEGEHAIQVNSTAIRAVLDPQLNYNLITRSAQTRTGLNTISIPPQDEEGEHTEDITYCAHVLIELSTGPLLPGMFLLTEDHIPGGYDLVLGKPWMMGVERYFAKHRFKQSQPTEDAPYVTKLATMKEGEEWLTDLSDDPEKTTWTAEWLRKRGFTDCANFVKSIKWIKTDTSNMAEGGTSHSGQGTPPSLGGSFARTL